MTTGAVLGRLAGPTARTTAWSPVLAATAGLLVVAVLLRLADDPDHTVLRLGAAQTTLRLGAAAVAAGTVFALHDPAAVLLAALPTSAMTRRLLRVGLVAAVVLPAWLLVAGVLPGPGNGLLPLLALTTTGLALATWLPAGPVALAASAPLVWVAVSELLGDVLGPAGTAAAWWHTRPLLVVAVACGCLVAGRHR
jgi:hypothetical protein